MDKSFNTYSSALTGAAAFPYERETVEDITSERPRRGHVDWQFMILTVVLLVIGLVMLFSASFANAYYERQDALAVFKQQLGWAAAGVAAMLGASVIRVSSKRKLSYRRYSMLIMYGSIALLALTLFPFLPFVITRNSATRWIGVGSAQFQPSELAKLGIILGFAQMLCRKTRSIKFGGGRAKHLKEISRKIGVYIRDVGPFVVVFGIVAFVLLKQPHMSACIIVGMITVIMLYAAGLDTPLVIGGIAAAVLIAVLVIMKSEQIYNESYAKLQSGEYNIEAFRESLGNYQLRRIIFWLHPDADPRGGGYQIMQSLYAVGSGGLTGQGFGQSRQKFFYLPEEHNDYIFAIVCEEIGFIGTMVIIIIFALLIMRGFWIAMHARDKFSSLIVIGIMGMLAVQVFLNIAVVTNSMPSTGISLPFFSYGGTALLIQLIEMGIVLSVSRDMPILKEG